MTVSRVINDRPGVGAQTRVTVHAAIRALGYCPNVAARSLVTAAELRIGVVYSNPGAAFMSDFLTGVLTVLGFDDTTAAVMPWPPLTTVHQPVRRLAAEALGMLERDRHTNTIPFGSSLSRTPRRVLDRLEPNGT